MRLFHTADLHIRESGEVSLNEQIKVLKQIQPDGALALVVAGDVLHGASTPAERNAAIEVFSAWADVAPTIVVRGNHDREGDLLFLSRLRGRHQIHVAEKFEFYQFDGTCFALMPWASRGRVAAWLPEADRLKVDAAAQGAIRMLFAGAATYRPEIFVGHVELGAATTDAGQPVAGRCDIEIGTDDLLDIGCRYYALGHIHAPQTIAEKIRYPGSPRQTNFGEAAGHGFTVWEDGKIEHVELTSPRFVTVDAEWMDDQLRMRHFEATPADHLRLVYSVPESCRAQAFEQAQKFAAQFAHCKIDPTVITVDRARHTEITAARTPVDKLREYWSAKSTPERSTQILAKLNEVLS